MRFFLFHLGTVISYSIYHSTYGTTTGSITMTANKTLTCNGTYSTKKVDTTWSQPTMTSNSASSGGTGTMVVSPSPSSSAGALYLSFDSTKTSQKGGCVGYATPRYYTVSTSTAIKISKITITNGTGTNVGAQNSKDGEVYGSSNGSSWTQLCSYTNSEKSQGGKWSITVNSGGYYKYHKVTSNNINYGNNSAHAWYVGAHVAITATYQTTSYTYYWNKTVS